MKSRLSSTIWMLVFFIGLALFGVLGLAYYAGAHSGAQAVAILVFPVKLVLVQLPWPASKTPGHSPQSYPG